MKSSALTLLAVSLASVAVCGITTSVALGQPARSEPATRTPNAASRVTVTAQQLIDSGHRLEVPAGTEVLWADAHFDRIWFPPNVGAPRVERSGLGYRAVFTTPGTYRGAFTIAGGIRSDDVYPLIVIVTER
jgi:hypothetical protein